MILHNPTVLAYLERIRAAADEHLKNLLPAAVDVIRRALAQQDLPIALRATDQLFRTQRKYAEPAGQPRETAEDVIARALEVIKGDVSVRVIEERRRR